MLLANEKNPFTVIGAIIVLLLILVPYYVFKYSKAHKSQKQIEKEMASRKFIGSFKIKITGVRGYKWILELNQVFARDRNIYPVFDNKNKIITIHYEEEVNKNAIRNLLIKIGYMAEIIE